MTDRPCCFPCCGCKCHGEAIDSALASQEARHREECRVTHTVERQRANALQIELDAICRENGRLESRLEAAQARHRQEMEEAKRERERLIQGLNRVREIHVPFGIYDECGHSHESEDVDNINVFEVPDVGIVCREDGLLAEVCRECHTDDGEARENSTEATWPCETAAAVIAALAMVGVLAAIRPAPSPVSAPPSPAKCEHASFKYLTGKCDACGEQTGRGYKPSSTKKRDPAADAANRQLDNPDSHENHHR